MRIAYLVSIYPAQSHTFIQREIAGLRDRGFEIMPISVHRPGPGDILGEVAVAEATVTRWLLPPPVDEVIKSLFWAVFTRPLLSLQVAWRALAKRGMGWGARVKWCGYLGEAILVAYWIHRDRIEHLHGHFGNAASNAAMLAAQLANVPWSITFHGIDLDEPERFRHTDKLATCQFAVCISKFGRSRLMHSTPPELWRKIHIIHCGLPIPEASSLPQPPGQGRILCVARLSVEKGHVVLLRALAALRERGIAFHCMLVGEGPLRAQLEQLVAELELVACVTFAGARTPDEVSEHIKTSDLLALASFGEGIPVALMEAMSHQRPVIATYVGGIPELVRDGHNGYLVPAGSVGELADAIEKLLSNPEMACAMGQRGRATVLEAFQLEVAAERLAALFRGKAMEEQT